MLRIAELPDFPLYAERGTYRIESHPLLPEDHMVERRAMISRAQADPMDMAAPLMGENSEAVLRDWLGLETEQVARLIEANIIEPVDPVIRDAAEKARAAAR
jgi:crotonobetainyl-CoA:carnitine CoA-transferase CaiB-like acyl-CoA transferase